MQVLSVGSDLENRIGWLKQIGQIKLEISKWFCLL
jgi:hypothetical protein